MSEAQYVSTAASAAYAHSYEHLEDELRLLDLLLTREVASFRHRMRTTQKNTQPHLYVTHDEVDRLLDAEGSDQAPLSDDGRRAQYEAMREAVDQRVAYSLEQDVPLMLPELARRFGLTTFEVQVVILCLAPELRRKYDRIFAYLQDDITRKRPSIDLALTVLCEGEREQWEARALLAEAAPLRYAQILQGIADPQSPSGSSALAQFMRLDTRVLQFVLGHSVLDPALEGIAQVRRAEKGLEAVPIDADRARALRRLAREHLHTATEGRPMVLSLHGACAKSRRTMALALAAEYDRPALCVDAASLLAAPDAEMRLRRVAREARLLQMPLYVARADGLRGGDAGADTLLIALERSARVYGGVVMLGSEVPWPETLPFEECAVYELDCPWPGVAQQIRAWKEALDGVGLHVNGGAQVHERLARRYRMTQAQIHDAATTAAHEQELRGGPMTFEHLAAVSRRQSVVSLGKLAVKVEPQAGWNDLIIPETPRRQLKELCDQVRHMIRVFEEWGFGAKLSYGKGVSALFSGPPGTGKTLAAEVLANDLMLDLYKVDLSQVVSKYIGETEKNLSRIFEEAEHSNAILFFDEADALFGKRTEISDAHDRYANIETSFLLQQMESHDGVVILASNLRENMDDAFQRRIRFVVEFPFPDAEQRLGIWKAHVPEAAPLDSDIDYTLLAERMQVAGGNIKNIMLNAAFFAAVNGQVIEMAHILQSARREYEKIGKLWDQKAFEQILERKS